MSRYRLLAGGALLLFIGYAGIFIWQTSFVLDGQRTFLLFDDAMISMAYARNLAEGFGLNWARWGAPVEGFTHPLWTFALVLPQLTGLDLALRPLLVQLASLVILVLNVLAVYRLALRHFCTSSPALALLPAIATAAYYPLNYWSLVGMESGLQSLLIITGIHWALDAASDKDGRVVRLFILAAVSILLRMDMALFAVAMLAWVFVTTRPGRHRGQWVRGVLLFLLLLGAYQAFRVYYFGDWLPNTYYLKLAGGDTVVRIKRGVLVFMEFLMPIVLTVGAATIGALVTLRERPKHALPLAIVCGYFAYSIYVGGDAWEDSRMTGNRFQCYVMPLVAVLFAGALDALLSLRSVRVPAAVALGLALLVSADLNGLLVGPYRDVRLGYFLLQGRPYNMEAHERVARDIHELAGQLPAETRVAVVWAGIPAYFSNFRMIDVMGYNDREIAHGPWSYPVPLEMARLYVPGHMKHNLALTLREKAPDVLFQWWVTWGEAETRMLESMGYQRLQTGPPITATAGVMWLRESAQLPLNWPDP